MVKAFFDFRGLSHSSHFQYFVNFPDNLYFPFIRFLSTEERGEMISNFLTLGEAFLFCGPTRGEGWEELEKEEEGIGGLLDLDSMEINSGLQLGETLSLVAFEEG